MTEHRSWTSLGLYAVSAVENQDSPVIVASALIFTTAYALVNLAVDLSYRLLDPQTTHA